MILTAERLISAPGAEVLQFLADASNNPRWQNGMRSCRWTTAGPITVGSQYQQEASFLGRRIRSTFEVIDLVPGSQIVIETIEGTFPIRVERRVERVDQHSCQVTATITGGPRVPRIVQGLVRWFAQRSVNADYDRLVALFETP